MVVRKSRRRKRSSKRKHSYTKRVSKRRSRRRSSKRRSSKRRSRKIQKGGALLEEEGGLAERGNLANCSVCMDTLGSSGGRISRTACNHHFCGDCLNGWFATQGGGELIGGRQRRTCPLCRAPAAARHGGPVETMTVDEALAAASVARGESGGGSSSASAASGDSGGGSSSASAASGDSGDSGGGSSSASAASGDSGGASSSAMPPPPVPPPNTMEMSLLSTHLTPAEVTHFISMMEQFELEAASVLVAPNSMVARGHVDAAFGGAGAAYQLAQQFVEQHGHDFGRQISPLVARIGQTAAQAIINLVIMHIGLIEREIGTSPWLALQHSQEADNLMRLGGQGATVADDTRGEVQRALDDAVGTYGYDAIAAQNNFQNLQAELARAQAAANTRMAGI